MFNNRFLAHTQRSQTTIRFIERYYNFFRKYRKIRHFCNLNNQYLQLPIVIKVKMIRELLFRVYSPQGHQKKVLFHTRHASSLYYDKVGPLLCECPLRSWLLTKAENGEEFSLLGRQHYNQGRCIEFIPIILSIHKLFTAA